MKMYDDKLDRAWRNYDCAVEAIAMEAFTRHIRPFLVKKGYLFLTGNGTWYIEDKSGHSVFSEDLPKTIADILDGEVEGMPANSFGSLMPNYIPADRRRQDE
jgi:hypothetical protein